MNADSYRTKRAVEFADTDAAGIAHFTAFFRWMEEVEHEFLRRRGLSVMHRDEEGILSWPRVNVECDFRGAVRFEDEMDVELRVARQGKKSLSYEINFSLAGKIVAQGKMTAACCRIHDGVPKAVEIPDWIKAKLASH